MHANIEILNIKLDIEDNMASLSALSVLGLLISSIGFSLVFFITFIVTRLRLGEIPPHKHDINTIIITTCSILWVILSISCILIPDIIELLVLFPLLKDTFVEIIGIIICVLGLGILISGFFEMKKSFRMGIPPKNEPPADLIVTGIFKYIRNPGFLGIDLAIFSTFLLVPTMGFGFLLILSWFSFHIQIKKEEKYLLVKHGKDYSLYIQKTGRYFPKLIK